MPELGQKLFSTVRRMPCPPGSPVLLDAAGMATVLEKFGGYGQQA